ncbi:MAG: DegT/DnrJ/EryC1/StrS family aminotransferase [Candidatus Omnitrophica bacterium]|nr:DegT/DnrJ/EryC1/StrS family aminotransferase [Candidatus Omnitrophota bacterium]
MQHAHIPLIDLQAQYRSIQREVDAAIRRVVARGQFVLGPEGDALERELAAYCGTRHAVALASGTDALELSLRALGIGPGDEVVTTVFSFFATAEAIIAAGATPVFADIEPQSYTLDPEAAARAVTRRTKAIIPVHLYGHPCDMGRIAALARHRRLQVIEDCAQAIGATWRGRRVGGFGAAGCLSFYPSKNLGGYGDGGMVVTNDARLARALRLLRNHGGRQRYQHLVLGKNSRLDELQAAILRVKLRYLDRWNAARRRHAQRYAAALTRRGLRRAGLPKEQPGCRHVYHLYTIRSSARARLIRALGGQGIATQVAYPSTLAAQPALRPLRLRAGRFPVAERAAREVLALPMYPELTGRAIDRIARVVAQSA